MARPTGPRGPGPGGGKWRVRGGGAVAGAKVAAAEAGRPRKVVTSWPGLGPDQLHQGRDLLHTTDFCDVLAELLRVHLGNPNLEKVLPTHEFKAVGLVEPV